MKTIKFFGLASIALVGLAQPTWAGLHQGGSGGGGHFGGGSRAAPGFSGGARFDGGGFRAAPALRSSGAYFTGRSVGEVSGAPRYYYGSGGMPAGRSQGFTPLRNRSITSNARRPSTISGQVNRAGSLTRQNTRVSDSEVAKANGHPNRASSIAGQNRVSNPRTSTAANRQSFVRNHAFERHDANWHRDWDKHRAHFHDNCVFVFVGGFWWGLYLWDYYLYYADDYYP